MNGNFKPTVTLADLYESQNQFLDAYVIYKYIYSMHPETHIKEKLYSLEKKIFEEYEKEYDPIIKKIFSKEEIEKFKILPTQQFSQYQEIESSFIEETNFNEIKNYKLRIGSKGIKCSELKEPKFYTYHLAKIQQFYLEVLGIPRNKFRFRKLDSKEKAFYNKVHYDI